ncbi:MAG: translation initiation factor IF-3 [Clostridia bacterium]|nr:translation initiation factor IF-3 [Clostridia bacterium]
MIKDVEINDKITDVAIRVIDENGDQLGIMSAVQANKIADEKNLDLVKISPTANPPVCKIMDYGKFRFDTAKKEKDARKNQKTSEMKEVWLSMTIDTHDLETKAKQAAKFLKNGDKVKVSIRMRGRQQAHAALGVEVMNDFFALVQNDGEMNKKPLTEGRNIIMILQPKK